MHDGLVGMVGDRVNLALLAVVWAVALALLCRGLYVFVLDRWPRRGIRARLGLRRSRISSRAVQADAPTRRTPAPHRTDSLLDES